MFAKKVDTQPDPDLDNLSKIFSCDNAIYPISKQTVGFDAHSSVISFSRASSSIYVSSAQVKVNDVDVPQLYVSIG